MEEMNAAQWMDKNRAILIKKEICDYDRYESFEYEESIVEYCEFKGVSEEIIFFEEIRDKLIY